MPILELALSVEFVYDKFTAAKANFLTDLFGVPDNLVTYSVPFGVRYFHPSGFFAGAGATYVNQEVNRSDSSGLPEGFDDFFLVDAALGYRLPRRFGIVSLSVSNLFDQRFYYQDDSFRTVPARETEPPQAAVGPYVPERTIMGQITINF